MGDLEDTVRNLLRMKPHPHPSRGKEKDEAADKEPPAAKEEEPTGR